MDNSSEEIALCVIKLMPQSQKLKHITKKEYKGWENGPTKLS